VRALEPAEVVVAVPTASSTACEALHDVADDVVCVSTPTPFRSVGDSYVDFDQTGDEEVRGLLRQAAGPAGGTRVAST
jgi:predicted phosphoribosyltransferase